MTDPVARINALTTNARNTWFVLLGVLVFVGITLLRVEHIDFYGVDRATTLPLVSVEVPTKSFFVAAPLLTAAIFGYFHLYLVRLWDALSRAPDAVDDTPLGDAISPWLVTDAALHLRSTLRKTACTTPRVMEGPAMALNLLLAWGFGLVILGALWWLSMPARTWWITTIAGLSLLVSAFAGAASLAMLVQRMREEHAGDPPRLWSNAPAMAVLLVAAPAVVIVGLQRTMGSADSLAHLSLMGENIVEKPVGWLSYAEAKAEFQTAWCSRENIPKCTDLGTRFTEFEKAWKTRRIAALSDLRKPLWHKPSQMKPDFRKGFLSEAFVSGINLSWAQMQEALLDGAQLEGAKLYKAQMMGAFLSNSQMQGADLQQAQLQKALFSNAQFQGSNFRWAQLQGAFLNQTQLQGANLYGAQMREVFLRGAQMEGTILHLSLLTGRADRTYHLSETNLVASKNSGGALRFLDLTHARIDQSTDWSNVFLDGSVIVPEDMRKQIGQPCLWAWIAEHPEPLTDAEFFGRWRGWLLLAPNRRDLYWGSMLSVPEEWRDVAPILPPSGCTWKTEPLPAAD